MTTVGGGAGTVLLDLPVDPAIALTAVRARLTTVLHDLGEDHRYDVLLVVTELVNNVLDHTPGTGHLRVLRQGSACEITVEVDDGSPAEPVHGRSRLSGTRGRGIVVVDSLARRWGTRPAERGKTVFALIACPADGVCAGT
ncbi:ATP-binding protein [Lentzea sp. NPDC060358]|uniref:ATP-binding protein n=1 Tax=Lentzea sp. NPDC060358 TaxID=3347103 RepID=UPI00366A2936